MATIIAAMDGKAKIIMAMTTTILDHGHTIAGHGHTIAGHGQGHNQPW